MLYITATRQNTTKPCSYFMGYIENVKNMSIFQGIYCKYHDTSIFYGIIWDIQWISKLCPYFLGYTVNVKSPSLILKTLLIPLEFNANWVRQAAPVTNQYPSYTTRSPILQTTLTTHLQQWFYYHTHGLGDDCSISSALWYQSFALNYQYDCIACV